MAKENRQKAAARPLDLSTEERIKAAAKKLFTQKGFAATRTRDIAEEAGINLALLNYYFRNKRRLFEIVMSENMQLFLGTVVKHLHDHADDLESQMAFIPGEYIDMLLKNPHLPFFVLQQLQSGSWEKTMQNMLKDMSQMRNTFIGNVEKGIRRKELYPIHPLHVMANLMGLVIFPFIAKPLLMARIGNVTEAQFNDLMEERKRLIPIWLKSMMWVHPA